MEAKVREGERRCKATVERIEKLPLSKITSACKLTLLRLVYSELNFLSRLSLSCGSFSLSCNIGYIEDIVHILEQPYITGVSRVCKPIPLSPAIRGGKSNNVAEAKDIHVDIVCTFHKNPVWFLVSDRNPKFISWNDSHQNKGLKYRIEQVLNAAQSSVALKPAFIILFFANGLDGYVWKKLEEFGFTELRMEFPHFEFTLADESEDEWVNILARSYQQACSLMLRVDQYPNACQTLDPLPKNLPSDEIEMEIALKVNDLSLGFSFSSLVSELKDWVNVEKTQSETTGACRGEDELINFDTTALIAIVSGISNGGTEKLLATPDSELRQRFKNNTEFVIAQVQSEIENPIHAELHGIISGKRGIICQTVHSEFMELVTMCGGPNENFRADQLVKRLKIVPDSPSPRMMSLPNTRKLAMKNKVTFGTGDYWRAPTLTANMGFVRAISQTGMSLFTIVHRPRALTGD